MADRRDLNLIGIWVLHECCGPLRKKDFLSNYCFEPAVSKLIGFAAVSEAQVECARQGKSQQYQVFFRSPSSFYRCSEVVVIFFSSEDLATSLERLLHRCINS